MAAKLSSLPSGKVFLQMLSCGIEDTAPSLFLFTDSKRYLFNCGEGIQRLFTEHKFKVGKLGTLFVTQNKWSHLGGFLGLSMTLRDIGRENINIYGPSGLQKVIHGARYFLNKDNVDFKVTEYSHENTETFEDDEITIKPVTIYPEKNKDRACSHWDTKSSGDDNDAIHSFVIKPSLLNPVVCYIAKLRDYPGKLLPKVAVKLGVPKGPMFRQLKDGQSVTLPSGKIVTPDEVMEAPIPGPAFLIIDCPARKYIPAIAKSKSFEKCQVEGSSKVTMVVHMAEKEVINDQLYQQWMARFDENTYHCILDKKELSKCPSVYSTQFAMQCQLNQVDANIFPLIEQWRNSNSTGEDSEASGNSKNFGIYTCKNLSKFNLRPQSTLGIDPSDELKAIDTKSIIQEAKSALWVAGYYNRDNFDAGNGSFGIGVETIDAENRNMKENIHSKRERDTDEKISEESNVDCPAAKICKCTPEDNDFPSKNNDHTRTDSCHESNCSRINHNCKFPKIVMLGTGSSMPSKYRNVSSILINASQHTSMLLDCGEGSYGQMKNHFGREAEEILKKLQFVFISHLHADHHLGLIRILKLRWKIMAKDGVPYTPPIIAGPRKLSIWLQEYSSTCESLRYRFVDCKRLAWQVSPSALSKEIAEFTKVMIVPVEHNTEAYGIAITHKDGWKITYSGDTVPCESLVYAGKDSTLLIHEATFEDGMEEDAKDKHHSTCGQALNVAEKMKARNVLLTHFSQRYSKLPVMKNETPVAVAFDHMEIHPDEIPEVSKLLPKLQVLFLNEDKR
eukprot:gene9410-17122_t